MELEIFNCEQNSPEWYAARLGIPTSSEFKSICAKGRGGGDAKTRRTYMLKLAGEILTQQPMYNYTNDHMERGKDMEDEARQLYAMIADIEPVRVGFMRRGDVGCSPDSLLGGDGLLEIKTKLPHLQIDCLISDRLPPEHEAQVYGQLWVTGRQWVDFVSYWPGLPLFRKRVERDERQIAAIKLEVEVFNKELRQLVEQIRNYGVAA